MKGVNWFDVLLIQHFLTSMLVIMTVAQSNNNILFELLEEQKTDTFVGNVAQQSGVQSEVAPSQAENLRYQILTSDGLRISSMFTINIRSGLLYTNAMIDREQICDSTIVTCKLEFDVTVKLDVTILRILHVVVVIKDINDNAPSFPVKVLAQNISEAFPKESDFSIPSANDRDGQMNTSITYWIEDNQVFGLKEEKLIGVPLLRVVLLTDLDREKQSEYILHIFAKDGSTSNSLTGTLTVVISVIDSNDNSPQFLDPVLNFTVSEDAEIGSLVGTINATDLDEGENGRISFNFSSFTASKVSQLFDLDADTGRVTVKSGLEYESGESFQAVVVAIDHGGSPKASQGIVIINIIDVGNTPPKLLLILVDQMNHNSAVLSEDLPGAYFVGTLRYQDNDKGDNAAVDCTSLNPHFALEYREDNLYAIEIDDQLDREAESEMVVVLKCTDHGTPSLSTFVNFTVRVLDVNDNKPVFEKLFYSSSLKEGGQSQKNILQVSATDKDEGVNKEVTYQLTQSTNSSFSIDPITGWISSIAAVDRETEPIIRLSVEAVDKGQPALTGSVIVTIVVEDINDNKPEITRSIYQVKENQDPGTFVAQIIATDLDDGLNSQLTFQLLPDSSDGFKVSGEGIITTAEIFDREITDRYDIIVTVNDNGTPSLTSTSTITIEISDMNDHIPDIIFPQPGNDTINISAGLFPGTVIAKVIANDSDLQKNAKLLYLIAEGNNKIFGIENATGTIYLAKRLTSSKETSYRLTISVQDGGIPRLNKNAFLYIIVDFSNMTLVDAASDMEQRYTIISGVIAGVTLVIALVVVTVILKLRRSDPERRRERCLKTKNMNLGHSGAKIFSEVNNLQVSTFKVDSMNREVEAREEKARGHNTNISLDGSLANGSIPASYRPTLTRELLDRQVNGSFPLFLEGRDLLTSEDIHSDTSGDATTSDSGRGASDGDDVSSGASLPPPYPQDTAASKFTTARLPSTDSCLLLPSNENRVFSLALIPDPNSQQLPRSPGNYSHQNGIDFNVRTASKVRFSFDDHRLNNPRFGRAQALGVCGQQFQAARPARPYQNIIRGERMTPPQQASGSYMVNKLTNQTPNIGFVNLHEHRNDPRGQFVPPSSVPLSKDALAKHNMLQTAAQQSQSPLNNQQFLAPNYNHHYHQQSATVNQSGDDDDDNNSTTTSGSYIVDPADDSVSTSVDC